MLVVTIAWCWWEWENERSEAQHRGMSTQSTFWQLDNRVGWASKTNKHLSYRNEITWSVRCDWIWLTSLIKFYCWPRYAYTCSFVSAITFCWYVMYKVTKRTHLTIHSVPKQQNSTNLEKKNRLFSSQGSSQFITSNLILGVDFLSFFSFFMKTHEDQYASSLHKISRNMVVKFGKQI